MIELKFSKLLSSQYSVYSNPTPSCTLPSTPHLNQNLAKPSQHTHNPHAPTAPSSTSSLSTLKSLTTLSFPFSPIPSLIPHPSSIKRRFLSSSRLCSRIFHTRHVRPKQIITTMKMATKPKRIPNWVRRRGCEGGIVGWELGIFGV